jgi:hypothetical protein
MGKTNILAELEDKRLGVGEIADIVIKDPDQLSELLLGIASARPQVKYGSAKVLRIISEKKPRMLYDHMDFFEALLGSINQILKWNAIDIIAGLTVVDSEDRFNGVLERFFSLLGEGNLITASHIVEASGTIARAKPKLAPIVEKKLLMVGGIPLPTEECRNILIGKTIAVFDSIYDKVEDEEAVLEFVRQQIGNPRNATKKSAERFLRKRIREQNPPL